MKAKQALREQMPSEFVGSTEIYMGIICSAVEVYIVLTFPNGSLYRGKSRGPRQLPWATPKSKACFIDLSMTMACEHGWRSLQKPNYFTGA